MKRLAFLLLLAGCVVPLAQAQNDAQAQQKYAARLALEFPNSEQSRALVNAAARPNTG